MVFSIQTIGQTILLSLAVSTATAQTTVYLRNHHKLYGTLLSFDKDIGMVLQVRGDTVFVPAGTYRRFVTRPADRRFEVFDRSTGTRPIVDAQSGSDPSTVGNRKPTRWYTELGMRLLDGVGEVDNSHVALGFSLARGIRTDAHWSFALVGQYHNITTSDVVSMLVEVRYHLTDRRTSPYFTYRAGTSVAAFSLYEDDNRVTFASHGGLGCRFGRFSRRSHYMELGLRTFRTGYSDRVRTGRLRFQQYLTYAYGIQF